MDTADGENTSNKSTIIEEQGQQTEQSTEEINTSTVSAEDDIENICEKLEKANEKAENQKETIEILKVELVASGRRDHVDVINEDNVDCSKNSLIIVEVKKHLLNSSGNGIENVAENPPNNEAIKEANDIIIETSDLTVQISEAEEGKHNLEERLTNTSKRIDAAMINGLSLLAQYDSDDDVDSVIEVPITSDQDYRSKVVQIDSDSDSDDSSASSQVEYLNEMRQTIEKRIELADEDGDEDENEDNTGRKRHKQKLRVKGEMLLEDLPPIQDLQITVPEDECIEFGKIHSIVDQLVLVSALPNSILLDLETVIFLERGQKVLGEVFDVLGQVADPLYCVRFNSNKQIKEKQINIADVVYVAPKTQYTQYVILSNLIKTRGSDASWENDVEPPPRFLDYSDDEQEQLAKRQLRNKDRPNDNEDPTKRSRTVDGDGSTSSSYQHNNRYQRNDRGGPVGHSNANTRPRCNASPQNQQRTPHHHRSSWHSNYYPQSFPSHPAENYRMHAAPNQPHYSQAYPPHVSPYAMPPGHMTYPLPQQTRYGGPPMFCQHPPRPMPNSFSFRPPTLHGPPVSHHQYSSTPPPPPGSQ